MELLAFHLHRLGAGRAEVVAFVADGAPWGWERLDWVERRVGAGWMWQGGNGGGGWVLRGAAVRGRWKDPLVWVREGMGRDGEVGWSWEAPDMLAELKAEIPITPPVPQKAVV